MPQSAGPERADTPDDQEMVGDPWRMVQGLMGHETVETTRGMYEAPLQELMESHTLGETASERFGAVGDDEFRELFARFSKPPDA